MDMGEMGGGEFDVLSWYTSIPPVSRVYFTSAFLTTSACAMDLLNPYVLYYDFHLVFIEGQVWRLFSSFLFFGLFSVDFVFHMYFLIRHCRQLEEGDFRGKPSSFVLMLIFGVTLICLSAPFVLTSHPFLGSALTFMMTYVWGRRNEDVRMAMFGVISFTAPYLPWVMVLFNFLVGNSIEMSLIGIFVGHLYYVLEYVYPVLAQARGWKRRNIMEPPRWLKYICGEREDIGIGMMMRNNGNDQPHLHVD